LARDVAVGAVLRRPRDGGLECPSRGTGNWVGCAGRACAFQEWEEWVNTALGAWLIVSPFILGFSTLMIALWNQLIVGTLVAGLSVWAAMTERPGLTSRS
jgi:hypothetical protein